MFKSCPYLGRIDCLLFDYHNRIRRKRAAQKRLRTRTGEKIEMKCPVCECKWSDEYPSLTAEIKSKAQTMKKVPTPCGHGYACLVRCYDNSSHVWYYEQIDFIRGD